MLRCAALGASATPLPPADIAPFGEAGAAVQALAAQTADRTNPNRAGAGTAAEQIKVYFAAPLFTQAEWHWNERLAAALRDMGFDAYLLHTSGTVINGTEEFDA